MKIKLKIFSIFVLTTTLLAIGGVSTFYYFSYKNLRDLATEHLIAVAKIKSLWLNTYLEEKRSDIGILAGLPEVKTMLQSDVDLSSQLYLQQWQNDKNYSNILVVNNQAEIIWSAEVGRFGSSLSVKNTKNSLAQLYQQASEQGIVISDYSEQPGSEPAMFMASSVYNGSDFLGVVIIQLSTAKIDSLMQNSTGLGETGKTFLVGRDMLMRSDTGDIYQSSILRQLVKTDSVKQCFSSYEENVFVGKDYRGYTSLGTYVYLPLVDWCLLAEIDEQEAFAPLHKLEWVYAMIAAILLLSAYVVASLLSRRISRPIVELQEGTEIIKRGNLNYKVGTKTNDEIGELSRLFDKMVLAIKRSRREVNLKVKEQTKEIRSQKNKLEKDRDIIIRSLDQVRKEKDKVIEERDKINAILHSIGDGVFLIGKDHKVMMFNQAAMNMSGFASREVIGKRYDKLLKFKYSEDEKVYHKFIEDTIKSGKIKEMSHYVLLQKKDGKYVPVNAIAAFLKNQQGEMLGLVVVLRDMTKERKVEKMKTEFVSLASHQLRTPLSAVKWFLEMILEGETGELNKEQSKILSKISASNERMIKLVNGLLNISRIEAGRMMVEPKLTDIIRLARLVIVELQPLIKAHNHKFEFIKAKKLTKINVDPRLVNQVMTNFLSNAIKYTPNGGTIEMKIQQIGKQIKISVKDNGLGIPQEQQDQIFKKFFRAQNVSSTDIKGTGLGLYVTKSIVEASGGKIGFKSEEGRGSTFWFTLPLSGSKKIKGEKGLEYLGIPV